MDGDKEAARQSWRAWKAVLGAASPGVLDALRPPASDVDLQQLRRILGDRWSTQFEALYQENDGEAVTATDDEPAFLWFAEPIHISGRLSYYFMPLAGIDGVLEGVGQMGGVEEDREAAACIPADTVLLPFGCDYGGNYLCLGLPPLGTGRDTPVFEAAFGEGTFRLLAPSLAGFLDNMTQGGA